jgi:hypothetical protein
MTQRQLGEKAPETRRRLMPPPAAAEYLGGVMVGTLAKWRHYGRGPDYIRVESRVYYDQADLDRYLDERRRTSTSQADSNGLPPSCRGCAQPQVLRESRSYRPTARPHRGRVSS